jgi:hypothetical protein
MQDITLAEFGFRQALLGSGIKIKTAIVSFKVSSTA